MIFRSCWNAHICRTIGNGRICINGYRLCRPTDRRSLDHYAPHSRCFSIFLFLFLSISPVPLTIPVPYKGTQFRRRGIVSASFETTLSRLSCIFIRGASLHSPLFGRYSSLLLFVSPIPRTSPSSSLLYFRYSHRSALNFLYNAGYHTRVVDAPTLAAAQRGLCECNACRAPRTCAHVVCAFRMRTQSTVAYSLTNPTYPRCLDRSGSIRISDLWIGWIGMLMHHLCRSRRCSKLIDFLCGNNKCFVRVIIFTLRLATILTWSFIYFAWIIRATLFKKLFKITCNAKR